LRSPQAGNSVTFANVGVFFQPGNSVRHSERHAVTACPEHQGIKMGRDSNDTKYRLAIRDIVANCGVSAKKLLAVDVRFTEEKVRQLARTSPEYQCHVIGRALASDTNPFQMLASTLLVYDTVRFGEVTSRLHRALGSVRKEAALLARGIEREREPNHLKDRLLTLDLIADQASRLRDLLADIEIVTGTGRKPKKGKKSKKRLSERLYAASALGLIAKNVRNVAVLQSDHLPRADQKELALRLTESICETAITARDHACRSFEQVDDACRVRPTGTPTIRVITHNEVDGDAVASAWLAERFLFPRESVEVLFLPRKRALGAYRTGDCLVAVGQTHDVENLFFDHKSPAFKNPFDSCAAKLIWNHLVDREFPFEHLRTLVDAVFAESLEEAADSLPAKARFAVEYMDSKRHGFHKALDDAKGKYDTDAEVYRTMRRWLDAHHEEAAIRKG
jgi:hypothetical protein